MVLALFSHPSFLVTFSYRFYILYTVISDAPLTGTLIHLKVICYKGVQAERLKSSAEHLLFISNHTIYCITAEEK